MSFYKIVVQDKVVDVLDYAVWVKEDARERLVITNADDAQGIVSSDGETVWHIEGTPVMPGHIFEDASAIDIGEDEWKELKTLLDLGGDVTNNGNGADVEFPEESDEPEEIPEDATLAEVKRICLQRLSDDCQRVIFNGFDVAMSDGFVKHFSLKIEDQLNLLSLSALVANGESQIPYHADGELCSYYSAEDMMIVIEAATRFKTYHASYYNSLKNWVESMTSIADVGAVIYGEPVPDEFCSVVLSELNQALLGADA